MRKKAKGELVEVKELSEVMDLLTDIVEDFSQRFNLIAEKTKILDFAIWKLQMFCRATAAIHSTEALDKQSKDLWKELASYPGQPTRDIEELKEMAGWKHQGEQVS